MAFARLSLSAIVAAGLSMALGSAPAQAQYADDPPNAYVRPAPRYDNPPPRTYAPDSAPAPAYEPGPAYEPDDGYVPPPESDDAPAPHYIEPGSEVGEVVIVAPYRRRAERDPATGAPIERVSTSRRVRYGDLDLTTDWGVQTLHDRVARAAQDACDSLDRHYHTLDAGDEECVARAIRDAIRQAPLGYASDATYEGR